MKPQLTKIADAISRAQLYSDQGQSKREILLTLANEMDAGFRSIVDEMEGFSYFIDFEKTLELALDDE